MKTWHIYPKRSYRPMCGSLQKLVVKPDQLIKRRGKLGLIKVGTDLAGVQTWVDQRMNKDQQVSSHTH